MNIIFVKMANCYVAIQTRDGLEIILIMQVCITTLI